MIQLSKNIIESYHFGDTGLLIHESTKTENICNLLVVGILVCFVALSLSVLCYKLYYYDAKISGALLIIGVISMILETFLFRIIAWWIYVLILNCIRKYKMRKKREEYERRRQLLVDISRDPKRFKELFKKYPNSFVTADVAYKEPPTPPQVINMDDIFCEVVDPETGIVRSRNPFDPISELDRIAASNRNRNGSFGSMEEANFPQFNRELPDFNAFESDIDSMAELNEFNKMLIDKMYAAYKEDADALLKEGNLKDIGTKQELLNKLEEDREKELKQAMKNYNMAAEVFGVVEESDEEDKEEERRKLMKKNYEKNKLPDTYYRDIAKIKAKRDLAKQKKTKKRLNSSADDSTNEQAYKFKGVYALDQTIPLVKQEKQLILEYPAPKQEVVKIDRHQIFIDPVVLPQEENSSEAIDENHIKFQSAQKSLGTETEKERYRGIASFQEQPTKFANYPDKTQHKMIRNIKESNLEALREKEYEKKFDGETTESVRLSENPSEKDHIDFKIVRDKGMEKHRQKVYQRELDNEEQNHKTSNSFRELNISKENMGKNTARLESNRPSMKSKIQSKKIEDDFKLVYRSPKYLNKPKIKDLDASFAPKINHDLDNIYGKVYDPFVKHNTGAVKQIEMIEREEKIRAFAYSKNKFFNEESINIDAVKKKPKDNKYKDRNIIGNGILLFGGDADSNAEYINNAHNHEHDSVSPPSYLKVVGKTKKKKKAKKKKIKREHLTLADLVVIGN